MKISRQFLLKDRIKLLNEVSFSEFCQQWLKNHVSLTEGKDTLFAPEDWKCITSAS